MKRFLGFHKILGLFFVISMFLFSGCDWAKMDDDVIDDDMEELEDLITVASPEEGETISLPLTVKGEARGNWYFEAMFPIMVVDDDGNVLATKSAQADGEWMTTEFVPFEVTFDDIDFGGATSGKIVLEKANASGLPENDAKIEIDVEFPES